MTDIAAMAFGLVVAHAVCDTALQSDAMARGKNRRRSSERTSKYQPAWFHWLTAHALIHGGAVALVTGVWWLGAAEAVAHALIDFNKCEDRYGMTTDQLLHYGCKALWLTIAVAIKAPGLLP